MVRIEPLVLDGLQPSFRVQQDIDAVELGKQAGIVRHELVFTMLHVGGLQFQIVVIELANQELQRQGIPHNLVFLREMSLLHSILHVVVGYGIVAPAMLHHEVVAETAFMDDDPVIGQVFQSLDLCRVVFLVQQAMGEYLDDRLAILPIIVMEMGIHAAHQVGMSVFQVVKGILRWFQLDNVGYVELFAQQF